MNCSSLRTLHGFINLLQLFGFAAIFACSFIWHNKNILFQIVYDGYGWQTVILLILIFTWLIALKIFYSSVLVGDEHVLEKIGKAKILLIYVVCLVLLTFSAAMESWYITVVNVDTDQYASVILKPRFITVTVFNWLMVAGYLILIGLTMFCG